MNHKAFTLIELLVVVAIKATGNGNYSLLLTFPIYIMIGIPLYAYIAKLFY